MEKPSKLLRIFGHWGQLFRPKEHLDFRINDVPKFISTLTHCYVCNNWYAFIFESNNPVFQLFQPPSKCKHWNNPLIPIDSQVWKSTEILKTWTPYIHRKRENTNNGWVKLRYINRINDWSAVLHIWMTIRRWIKVRESKFVEQKQNNLCINH